MTTRKTPTLIVSIIILTLSVIAVFGWGADKLGFYSDDAGFFFELAHAGVKQTFDSMLSYVPGRNLHMIWQRAFFLLAGAEVSDLWKLHLLQSALDGMIVATFFLILLRLGVAAWIGFVSALMFAFYPNHGETHYWLSAAPMNLMSTLFVLLHMYLGLGVLRKVLDRQRISNFDLAGCCLLSIAALFTYDQTVVVVSALQGVLSLFVFSSWCLPSLRCPQTSHFEKFASSFLLLFPFAWVGLDIYLKLHPLSGPTLSPVGIPHIIARFWESVRIGAGPALIEHIRALLAQTDGKEPLVGAVIAILGVAASIVLFLKWANVSDRPASCWRYLLGSLAALAWALCAYFPAYLWAISPRHNFLPTAGLVSCIAFLLEAFRRLLSGQVTLRVAFLIPATLGVAILAGAFATVARVEHHHWAAAYQLRTQLYQQVREQGLLSGKKTILVEGFPIHFGTAPFFAVESRHIYNYFVGGKLIHNSLAGQATPTGYFMDTDYDRWGAIVSRYFPRADVAHLKFVGTDGRTLNFKTSADADWIVDAPPSFTPVANTNVAPSNTPTFSIHDDTINLTLEVIEPPSGARLGAIPYGCATPAVPTLTTEAFGIRKTTIFEIPSSAELNLPQGSTVSFATKAPLPLLLDTCSLKIFQFSSGGPKLLFDLKK
ncbi:MAG: hypothetical protein J0M12_10510 [Deltaproteobacteria bacterium]|nr:hypothetical protein [Deltaproteobacteria bacterium]